MSSTILNVREKLAPPWLLEGDGYAVGYSLDLMKAALLERTEQSLLARFPQRDASGTPAPDDILALLGRDRGIIRGIGETGAGYAARLKRWITDHKVRGNPFALMRQLQAYIGAGSSFRTVDANSNWYSLDSAGVQSFALSQANWNWDDPPARQWAQFFVIIYPGTRWEIAPVWGDPGEVWGDEVTTWGTTAAPGEVASVKQIVKYWRPAGTKCRNIIIAFDEATFTPSSPTANDGLYRRNGKTVNGVRVPSRLASARYWDGA